MRSKNCGELDGGGLNCDTTSVAAETSATKTMLAMKSGPKRLCKEEIAMQRISIALTLSLAFAAACSDNTETATDAGLHNDAAVATDMTTSDLGGDATVLADATTDSSTDASTDAAVDASLTHCSSTADCGSGFYCHKAVGDCGGDGVCEAFDPAAACDVVPMLRCGCDGHTYNNDCDAARHASSVDFVGRCEPIESACTSDLDCADGDFCEFEAGTCGGTGTCITRGIGFLCANICNPECGCDGVTYQNPCLRHKAAASLQQGGVCPDEPPPCETGGACCSDSTSCEVGQECIGGHPGAATGKCEPILASPDCWIDEDCGAGHVCVDAFVCGCGETCPRPDAPGTCD